MTDITTLLKSLESCLRPTVVKQMTSIVTAILAMSGRVTMLGISRWTEKGGSYRTVQRFYNTTIPWLTVLWVFFREQLLNRDDCYLLAGDESVVTKAGKTSYGLNRFFSSLYGKPVPGLAFFVFSLINVRTRTASPLMVEQVVRDKAENADLSPNSTGKKGNARPKGSGKAGRPPGSKNRDKQTITWTPLLRLLATMLSQVMPLFIGWLTVKYLVMDGQFGNNNTVQMVRQTGLHLISKLRADSALFFPYAGPQPSRGRKRIYGDRMDYDHIPECYCRATCTAGNIHTRIYQAVIIHGAFALPLNVVVLHKTNLKTQAVAHLILFTTDLDLAYDSLIDYYSLRFQIEFNFRDAKQFWGFEDFMNVKQIPLTNAVNLAFFMVNLSHALLANFRHSVPDASLLDLKAFFRSRRYLSSLLQLLPQIPDPLFIDQLLANFDPLGAIHPNPQSHSLL